MKKKSNLSKPEDNYTKITKVTLVIYCLIMALGLVAFGIVFAIVNDPTYLYGFLLCLGPGLLFVFASCFLPIPRLLDAKASKGIIVWYVIAYVLKYAAIIGIPFIGLVFDQFFNKWVMLATTLIAPITVIIIKIIFANYVSKKAKNRVKS